MNLVDSIVAAFSPQAAVRRKQARMILAAYEGGRSTKRRKKSRDNSTGERQVVRDAATVRATVRDLERNHDLVRGALLALSRNVVGPTGISIEPQPRKSVEGSGYDSIDDDFARTLLNAFREWTRAPEVTRTLSWVQTQELACRSWLRDGEVFTQLVEGSVPLLKHSTAVPLSIELLEADFVPLDYDGDAPLIEAGIEKSEWGEPAAFYVYKRHPGRGGWTSATDLKRVPASRMLHLAARDRLSGLRGISTFASTIDRLLDVKDYESSEQLAARVTARIAASIKRDVNMQGWTPPVKENGEELKFDEREFMLDPAAILDNMWPGEELNIQNPTRPNPNLGTFRRDMVRAASRAVQLSYSSFAGDYDGTYSAQRQELIEAFDGYRMLTEQFVARFVRPIWERFVTLAIASGAVKVPAGIRPETVAQAEFRGPKMPWIDPQKEAGGLLMLSRGGWQSLQQGIADRGGRLQDVFEQLKRERTLADELGLVLDSDARYASNAANAPADVPPPGDGTTPDPNSRVRVPRQRLNGHGATH